jgi:hypothetical protein
MTDTEFQEIVNKLFDKHARRLGGDHWAKGDLGLDEDAVHDFANDLKEILEKEKK